MRRDSRGASSPRGVAAWLGSGLLALIALTEGLAAQSNNDLVGSLVINGVNAPPPNLVEFVPPDTLGLAISGNAGVPFLLAWAPGISVAELSIGPGQSLDIGPLAAVDVLLNGLTPASFVDLFANTGPLGTVTFLLPAPVRLPVGSLGALQALLVDPTGPSAYSSFTAATEVVALARCDFGSVVYSAGDSFQLRRAYRADGASGIITAEAAQVGVYRPRDLWVERMDELAFSGQVGVSVDHQRPPTALRPSITRPRTSRAS